jgi:hypothetical protein
MMRALRPGFDHNVLSALFGVVFRDRLDSRVVAAGLNVSLRDPRRPGSAAQRLAPNGQGVFVAHAVRGLRAHAGGQAASASPSPTRRFELAVSDPLGRYLPLRVPADLPHPDLFEPAYMAGSPGADAPHVPLYSAAARPVSTGCGVLRADLRLASNPAAGAAWARLELWLDTALIAEGMADRRGSALLLFALPALRDAPLRSSPHSMPDAHASWQLTLRCFWDPRLAQAEVPDLYDLQQAAEVPLLQRRSPATTLDHCLLQAGAALIVRSDESSFVFVGA